MQIESFLNASYLRINNTSLSSDKTTASSSSQKKDENTNELTAAQKALVAELQAIDTKVRAHENAHIAAGGGVIRSGAVFSYEKAPDERLYAVGGEVGIDTSEGATPEETVTKMQTVRAAALAPSDPSPTDYQVASTASMLQMMATLEVARLKQAELLAKPKESYSSANNEDTTSLFSNYA
ncbi:putative metalloprotease CJM1_0395 family protein [Sulfurospirillum oryzae]|uniref:putative metalloprotease CJM1_0395 family protein n=1 Tax=Sulfurospirillum oryzae TaxID=2976535 RepID=UPI0021E7F709|nr:putative metalloprotease CJM1_0395 family protein [Sulfurospirillum oryzae]